MGGEREEKVEQRSTKKDGAVVGSVRFHENAGEVHFHDDDNGLKVAVPTGRWHKLWDSFASGEQKKFTFVDVERKTRLVVKRRFAKGLVPKAVNVFISIEEIGFSDEFKALQKFTNG